VSHRIQRQELEPGLNSSHFLIAFERWRELDCSSTFVAFTKDVETYTRSLPLLLHHKDEVVRLLLEHLQVEKSMSTKALLELVSVLARDLRYEFYPYLGRVINVLVELLNPSEPEALEDVFSCLSFLFKFLAKQLVNDVHNVYRKYYAAMLMHRKPYIRRWAAESFAFLLRKVRRRDVMPTLTVVLSLASAPADVRAEVVQRKAEAAAASSSSSPAKKRYSRLTDYQDGVAHMLFEMTKGLQFAFHSNMTDVVEILCTNLGTRDLMPSDGNDDDDDDDDEGDEDEGDSSGSDDDSDDAAVKSATGVESGETNDLSSSLTAADPAHRYAVVAGVLRRMCNHARRDTAAPVWTLLFAQLTIFQKRWFAATAALAEAEDAAAAAADGEKRGKAKAKAAQGRDTARIAELRACVVARGEELGSVAGLVHVWVVHRGGSRIVDGGEMLKCTQQLFAGSVFNHALQSAAYVRHSLRILSAFWSFPAFAQLNDRLALLLPIVFAGVSATANDAAATYDRYPVVKLAFVSRLVSASLSSASSSTSVSSSHLRSDSSAAPPVIMVMMPHVVKYAEQWLVHDTSSSSSSSSSSSMLASSGAMWALAFLLQLARALSPAVLAAQAADAMPSRLMLLTRSPLLLYMMNALTAAIASFSAAASLDELAVMMKSQSLSHVWACLRLLPLLPPHLYPLFVDKAAGAKAAAGKAKKNKNKKGESEGLPLLHLLSRLSTSMKPMLTGDVTAASSAIYSRALFARASCQIAFSLVNAAHCAASTRAVSQPPAVLWQELFAALQMHPAHIGVLRAVHVFLQCCRVQATGTKGKTATSESTPFITTALLPQVCEVLASNLAATSRAIRQATINILAVFPMLQFADRKDAIVDASDDEEETKSGDMHGFAGNCAFIGKYSRPLFTILSFLRSLTST
jgi:hypothetical protein